MQLLKVILVVLMGISFSGCVTFLTNYKQPTNQKEYAQYGYVFGRFNFNLVRGSTYLVTFKNTTTSKEYTIRVIDKWSIFNRKAPNLLNHEYCVALPAGQYILSQISTSDNVTEVTSSHKIYFNVEPEVTMYLGTLTYDWKQTKNYILFGKGNVYLEVFDNHDDESKVQSGLCPGVEERRYKINLLNPYVEKPSNLSDPSTIDIIEINSEEKPEDFGFKPIKSGKVEPE